MKNILVVLFLSFCSLFAQNCDKNKIVNLVDIDTNIMHILSSHEDKEILPGFCKVVTVIKSDPNAIDIIYANPESKMLIFSADILKQKNDSTYTNYTVRDKVRFTPVATQIHDNYIFDLKESLNKKESFKLQELQKNAKAYIIAKEKQDYSLLSFSSERCGQCFKQKKYLQQYSLDYALLSFTSKNEKKRELITAFANELGVVYTPFNLVVETKTNKVVDVIVGFNTQKLEQYFTKRVN